MYVNVSVCTEMSVRILPFDKLDDDKVLMTKIIYVQQTKVIY